jgi:hypothetical protein
MEQLLSGFLGALIATILSLFYLYLSEQKKLRADIFLETVTYSDDIYMHLIDLRNEKNAEFTGKKRGLIPEEYRIVSRELTAMLLSSKPGIKLALVYGDSDVIGTFNELRSYYLKISSLLRCGSQGEWETELHNIDNIFSEKIGPLRSSFERLLLHEIQTFSILRRSFKNPLRKQPKFIRSKEA